MYQHQYRCQVLYGHFGQFMEVCREIQELEAARGWAVSSLWAPTVGVGNEAVIIAEYDSLATFERERAQRYGDAEFMKLARRSAELMAQGSLHDELLERAPALA